MRSSFQSGLVCLLALLMVGASGQAAACDVACAVAAQTGCCAKAAIQAKASMPMRSGHCEEAMPGISRPVLMAHAEAGPCQSFPVMSVEKNAARGGAASQAEWVVVEVLPLTQPWLRARAVVAQSWPRGVAWSDRWLGNLRV